LFRQNYDYVLLRCLEKSDTDTVLIDLYDGIAGGNFSRDIISHKILQAGYYWTTLLKDAHTYVRKCKVFQTSVGREKKTFIPITACEDRWTIWTMGIGHHWRDNPKFFTVTHIYIDNNWLFHEVDRGHLFKNCQPELGDIFHQKIHNYKIWRS